MSLINVVLLVLSTAENASITPERHTHDHSLVRKVKDTVKRFGAVSKLVIMGDATLYRLTRNMSVWNPWETVRLQHIIFKSINMKKSIEKVHILSYRAMLQLTLLQQQTGLKTYFTDYQMEYLTILQPPL